MTTAPSTGTSTTSTTGTPGTTGTAGLSRTTVGYIVQLGGLASITAGAIFSVHHLALGAAFLGGAAAFFVGEKIRSLR